MLVCKSLQPQRTIINMYMYYNETSILFELSKSEGDSC